MSLRSLIQARIQTQCPQFKEVAGTASIEGVMAGRLSFPGCYVLTPADRCSANETVNRVVHNQRSMITILIAARNVSGERGAAAADDVDELAGSVLTKLLGFTPAIDYSPLEKVSGGIFKFFNGYCLYALVMQTNTLICG